jgi:enoyl-CoA hydratase/carnithine racemase
MERYSEELSKGSGLSYETLILEHRGPVGWIILNRPDSLNAHNLTMLSELPRAWSELDADDDVRVIVMTGQGRAFCAGADVKEVAASGGGMADRMRDVMDGGEFAPVSARSNEAWKLLSPP